MALFNARIELRPSFPTDHGAQGAGEYGSHGLGSPALFDERGQRSRRGEWVVVKVNDGDVLVIGSPSAG
jgi:hypothetical protein